MKIRKIICYFICEFTQNKQNYMLCMLYIYVNLKKNYISKLGTTHNYSDKPKPIMAITLKISIV